MAATSLKLKKIFEPGYIGPVRIKNRMVKMGNQIPHFPREDGYVQQRYIDLYEALAKGGAGLVTISSDIGRDWDEGFSVTDDKYIPRLRDLTDTIHKHDCPIFLQLYHVGPWDAANHIASSDYTREDYPMPGMDLACITRESWTEYLERRANPTPGTSISSTTHLPRAVTLEEIKGIVNQFAEVAERAKRAGFDGFEVNAGSSHFLNTFLSPAWNKRQDEYGGNTENRCRIVVEIIQSIKKLCGKDFPVVVLFNAAEPGLVEGITITEARAMAKKFEAAGADAIHARVDLYNTRKSDRWQPLVHKRYDSTHFPDVAFYPEAPAHAVKDVADTRHHGAGGWAPAAAAIKKAVKIPVIAVGRLDPQIGEKMIKRGEADFINLIRRLQADHDLPNKIREGRFEDIAPCTGCMTCFAQFGVVPDWISCRVNATFTKEKAYEIKPAPQKKKVVVVGGGPGGMEAARVAALRGHQVILFEKNMLGGAANVCAVVKGAEREDISGLIDYLKIQITKAGVDIRLGKEATKEAIEELKPDVVIIAAGAFHSIPDLPGINGRNVFTSAALHDQMKKYIKITGTRLMTRLATKYVPVGRKVVIIGGSIQGCQTAEFLAKRGRKVTILESGPRIGDGLLPCLVKPQLLDWLEKHDVAMLADVKIEKITDKGVVAETADGAKQTFEADTVLIALPMLPNTQLIDSLRGTAAEVYAIGDCHDPKLIAEAINEGSKIAREF